MQDPLLVPEHPEIYSTVLHVRQDAEVPGLVPEQLLL